MKRILVLLAVVTIASVVAAACGDDDGDLVSGHISGVGPGISSGVGPGIFVGQALISGLTGPLLVNGQRREWPSTSVRSVGRILSTAVCGEVPCGAGLRPDNDRWPHERGFGHLVGSDRTGLRNRGGRGSNRCGNRALGPSL